MFNTSSKGCLVNCRPFCTLAPVITYRFLLILSTMTQDHVIQQPLLWSFLFVFGLWDVWHRLNLTDKTTSTTTTTKTPTNSLLRTLPLSSSSRRQASLREVPSAWARGSVDEKRQERCFLHFRYTPPKNRNNLSLRCNQSCQLAPLELASEPRGLKIPIHYPKLLSSLGSWVRWGLSQQNLG